MWYNVYKIIAAIIQALSIGITLLLGLSLIGEELQKIIKKLIFLIIIMSIAYYFFYDILTSDYAILLIYLSLIPVMKKAFKHKYSYTIIAVLLGLILELIMQILSKQAAAYFFMDGNIDEARLYIGFAAVLTYSLLWTAIYLNKISLFSRNWTLYPDLEKSQRKSFNRYVQLIIFVLVLMVAWIFYIMEGLSYSFNQQVPLLIFTIIFFTLFLYLMRILVFYGMERVEIFIDKQYQKEMLGFIEIIRSQRHDFNFHLQAILGMLENGNNSECRDYVKTMVKDTHEANDILNLYHPAVGALLGNFRKLAANKGIDLQILIHYNLENIPCTVYEINKILGNLLQNAIDEVEQHQEGSPWVKIMILKRSGNCVFKVSNKIEKGKNSFKNIFDSGYSTKASHEGIGLNTVQKIVSKYEGIIYTEFEDDIIHFIVQIPIKY